MRQLTPRTVYRLSIENERVRGSFCEPGQRTVSWPDAVIKPNASEPENTASPPTPLQSPATRTALNDTLIVPDGVTVPLNLPACSHAGVTRGTPVSGIECQVPLI